MPVQVAGLSSRRTVLLAVLASHERFLSFFFPERDAIEIDIRIAKLKLLSTELETIQSKLEDAAISNEEQIAQNAALREDFEPRLIRVEALLKAKRCIQLNANTPQITSIKPLGGLQLPTIALPKLCGSYTNTNRATATPCGKETSYQHKPAKHTLTYTPQSTSTFATAPTPAASNAPAWKAQNTGTFSTAPTSAAQNVPACCTYSIGSFSTAIKPAAQNAPVTHTQHTNDHTASTQRSDNTALRQTPEKVMSQTAVANTSDVHAIVHPTLLDVASQPNLMSNRFSQRLRIKPSVVSITQIGVVQFSTPVRKTVRAKIVPSFELHADLLIGDQLIHDLPAFAMPWAAYMVSRQEVINIGNHLRNYLLTYEAKHPVLPPESQPEASSAIIAVDGTSCDVREITFTQLRTSIFWNLQLMVQRFQQRCLFQSTPTKMQRGNSNGTITTYALNVSSRGSVPLIDSSTRWPLERFSRAHACDSKLA
uniref:uncharacterized protein LOC120957837 n=1 Tax=Anopheles coluzzii TaxID=1518534 RepID=UPI0020FF8E34|nr:uncharacterized protein LOC120957837 [Anopheles coluzzii]XP_049462782.1 uncharacterized protein LOC120957837 [Anopheles coluzzii]